MADESFPDTAVPVLEEEGAAPVVAPSADPTVPTLREDDTAEEDTLPAHAVLRGDGSVLVPWLYPDQAAIRYRKVSSEEVREERFPPLVMRRLTGADMRAIGAAEERDRAVVAIARSAKIQQGKMNLLYDALDAADAAALARVVSYFLGSGPQTGR